MRLAENEIHLWFARCSQINDAALLRQYRGLLNSAELARQQRFRFQRDRHRDLIARAVVRTTLSRYADVPAADWCFEKGEHDKPEIVDPPIPLRFNLSHSGDFVLCAVALRQDVGVDIESIRRNNDVLNIAKHYFSEHELGQLNRLPVALRRDRFFDYWTLKESFMKARGEGISLGLANFSFDLASEERIGIHFSAAIDDNPLHWQFWLCDPCPDYRLALAWHRGLAQGVPSISLYQTTPLQSLHDRPWRPRRATA